MRTLGHAVEVGADLRISARHAIRQAHSEIAVRYRAQRGSQQRHNAALFLGGLCLHPGGVELLLGHVVLRLGLRALVGVLFLNGLGLHGFVLQALFLRLRALHGSFRLKCFLGDGGVAEHPHRARQRADFVMAFAVGNVTL